MRLHLQIKRPIRQKTTVTKIQENATLEGGREEGIPRKARKTEIIRIGGKIIQLRNMGYQQPDMYVCEVAGESHKTSHDVWMR